MAQVKFYYKESLPSTGIDEGGVYFIQNGELYRGAQRFGLGRVTKASTADELSALTSAARGDINVGFEGAKVFDGSAWQKLGGDVADIRAIVSSMTSGLVAGGNGSYITGISQDPNGDVTANAVAFPTLDTGDHDGEVKLGTDAAKVSGWDDLVASVGSNTTAIAGLSTKVSTLETKVSGIEDIVDVANGGTVTASSGVFTNLTVSDTATFDVTNIVASSLTVNGSTVEQIADARITAIAASTVTSTATGITVSVTTQGGSVTAISLNAESFTNVMHFLGVGTVTKTASGVEVTPPQGKTPVAGDIVIDSNTGLEAICTNATGPTWELIGDNATYALNAYSSEAAVYTGVTTVPGALNAAGAAIDTLNTDIATKASVGTGTAQGAHGISGEVVLAADDKPTLTISVDAITASTSVAPGEGKVVTAGAVADYVTDAISTATTYAPGYERVTADADTLDEAMHAVAGAIDAYVGGSSTGSWTAPGASAAAISTTVGIDASTMTPTVTMAVNVNELRAALGVTTTVNDSSSTKLTTEGAVKTYVDTALSWITD